MKHKSRSKYYCAFSILSSIYLKHFSIKSKLTITNGYLWPKNQFYKYFLSFFKICSYGYQKIRLAKPNSNQQTVCKNIQKHAIQKHLSGKYQGNHKISCFPQFLSSKLAIFHYFVKQCFPLETALKDVSFDDHILTNFEGKKHSYWRFLSQKKIFDGQF